MSAQLTRTVRPKLELVGRSVRSSSQAAHIFSALAPLHGFAEPDASLLERAAAGCRFMRAIHPFGVAERQLMRDALADLPAPDADVVEAAADCVVDLGLTDQGSAWNRLQPSGRLKAMWFTGILRLAESVESACSASSADVHCAWSDQVLHIEIDGASLARTDAERVRARAAALEATAGRRVLITSSTDRRGAA